MFAFDVSLCEISTLGPMEQHNLHAPSLPFPQQNRVCQQVVSSNCCLFLNPTKRWFSLKLMQMFQNWVSDICKCFSLLDKNVWPLTSLGLYYFLKEEVDRTIILHLLLHWKDVKSFGRVGRCGWKELWKIYNQDILWHIKRKILIAVLAFIWIFFFISVFSL